MTRWPGCNSNGVTYWAGRLAPAADQGQLAKDTEPEQLAFELGPILAGTNIVSVLHDDTSAIARGRAAIRSRLSRTATAQLAWLVWRYGTSSG